jgi:hypothetical protein
VERPPAVPPHVHGIGATEHGLQVALVGFDACWVQRDGQDRQSGWLLELDDADGWERIQVDDPETVQPTSDGPKPVLVPGQR